MTLRSTLTRLIRAVSDEAERNPPFEAALVEALRVETTTKNRLSSAQISKSQSAPQTRAKNRRAPAVLDPIEVAKSGESPLRQALGALTLDQLRDIVAEYGMDSGKLVMKWIAPDRVIDRVVEIALKRAHKGDAFRKVTDSEAATGTSVLGDG